MLVVSVLIPLICFFSLAFSVLKTRGHHRQCIACTTEHRERTLQGSSHQKQVPINKQQHHQHSMDLKSESLHISKITKIAEVLSVGAQANNLTPCCFESVDKLLKKQQFPFGNFLGPKRMPSVFLVPCFDCFSLISRGKALFMPHCTRAMHFYICQVSGLC